MGRIFNVMAIRRGLDLDNGHVSKAVSVDLEGGKTAGRMEWNEVSTPRVYLLPSLQRIQGDDTPGSLGLEDQDQVTTEEKRDEGGTERGKTVMEIVKINIFASPPPKHVQITMTSVPGRPCRPTTRVRGDRSSSSGVLRSLRTAAAEVAGRPPPPLEVPGLRWTEISSPL